MNLLLPIQNFNPLPISLDNRGTALVNFGDCNSVNRVFHVEVEE